VEHWEQFEVEVLRYVYPDVLGAVRADPRWAELIATADRSRGVEV